MQRVDRNLRSFTIKGYGRFVEISQKERRLESGKLIVRVAYAVNTSKNAEEQKHDSIWIVKPG